MSQDWSTEVPPRTPLPAAHEDQLDPRAHATRVIPWYASQFRDDPDSGLLWRPATEAAATAERGGHLTEGTVDEERHSDATTLSLSAGPTQEDNAATDEQSQHEATAPVSMMALLTEANALASGSASSASPQPSPRTLTPTLALTPTSPTSTSASTPRPARQSTTRQRRTSTSSTATGIVPETARLSTPTPPPTPTPSPTQTSTLTDSSAAPAVKWSRYLREMDRRSILARLERGERQADLAREYSVSRTAISNLARQRDKILARQHENPLAKHPKSGSMARLQSATNAQGNTKESAGARKETELAYRAMSAAPSPFHPVRAKSQSHRQPRLLAQAARHSPSRTHFPATSRQQPVFGFSAPVQRVASREERAPSHQPQQVPASGQDTSLSARQTGLFRRAVHVFQSRSLSLFLTTLYNREASTRKFRHHADRLLHLLLEEALGFVPVTSIALTPVGDGMPTSGIVIESPPCGISMEENESPMLDHFRLYEPGHPCGLIRVVDSTGATTEAGAPKREAICQGGNLPASLADHNVFLFYAVAVSGQDACAVLTKLLELDAVAPAILIVCVVVSADVIAMVQYHFPGVRILTTKIDISPTNRQGTIDVSDACHFLHTRWLHAYSPRPILA